MGWPLIGMRRCLRRPRPATRARLLTQSICEIKSKVAVGYPPYTAADVEPTRAEGTPWFADVLS